MTPFRDSVLYEIRKCAARVKASVCGAPAHFLKMQRIFLLKGYHCIVQRCSNCKRPRRHGPELPRTPSSGNGASIPLLAPLVCAESQALAYLGTGYNIITGDPHTERVRDPGWQNDIISRSYLKEEWVKPDGRCSYDATNFQITGAKSAQTSRKSEWKSETSVGLFKIIQAAFTASSSVQKMDKESRSYGFTFFETRAECHLKTAKLPAPSVKYEFTADFEAAVKAIPTDGSAESSKCLGHEASNERV